MKNIHFAFLSILLMSCQQNTKNIHISGMVFGTTYSVLYDSTINYEVQFDSLYDIINGSLSTYIPTSDISKLNRNEDVEIDHHFLMVYKRSKEIYDLTEGIFDPTIGAIVNAWDFGPEGKIVMLDSSKIKDLMTSVGMNKVRLNGKRIEKLPDTYMDFNAIAKGYAVDVIGSFLEGKGVENYLVEIGGEIKTKGINMEKGQGWVVGIDNPNFDGTQSVLSAVSLQNAAMATSGTYRKFKVDDDGNRYAHIIDTKTGYPAKTNILGVSVIAEDCMTADAYATAFQAMGIQGVSTFLKRHPKLKVLLILENDSKELETMTFNDFPEN